MNRIFTGLLGLLLVGCQQTVVTPGPLPQLRESALGQTLNLSGQVEDWPAGLTAEIVLERYAAPQTVIGSVSDAGAFRVSTTAPLPLQRTAVSALLGPVGPENGCAGQDLQLSDAAVRAFELPTLRLIRQGPASASLRPQLSPPVRVPELRRQAGNSEVRALYVDRDLRVVGTQVCSGQSVVTGTRWQRATSINVQLRAGWNLITVTSEVVSGQDRTDADRLTVQGGDPVVGTVWTYNGVPLDR